MLNNQAHSTNTQTTTELHTHKFAHWKTAARTRACRHAQARSKAARRSSTAIQRPRCSAAQSYRSCDTRSHLLTAASSSGATSQSIQHTALHAASNEPIRHTAAAAHVRASRGTTATARRSAPYAPRSRVQIGPQRAREQHRVLRHDGELRAQVPEAHARDVQAINQDAPGGNLHNSEQREHQRALAGTRPAVGRDTSNTCHIQFKLNHYQGT